MGWRRLLELTSFDSQASPESSADDDSDWWAAIAKAFKMEVPTLKEDGAPHISIPRHERDRILGKLPDEANRYYNCSFDTYGEILPDGMRKVVEDAGAASGGKFVDVGSGNGIFTQYACRHGFSNCVGVEISKSRFDAAQDALHQVKTPGVEFLHGDVRNHPEVFDNVKAVFADDICMPELVIMHMVKAFVKRAPKGARLYSLMRLRDEDGPSGFGIDEEKKVELPASWKKQYPHEKPTWTTYVYTAPGPDSSFAKGIKFL